MRDYVLPLPRTVDPHTLHRAVFALLDGQPRPLYTIDRDALGGVVVLRSHSPVPETEAQGAEVPAVAEGARLRFRLRAAVSFKRDGRRWYPPSPDTESRRRWIERQAGRHGFAVESLAIDARKEVMTKDGRGFAIDDTVFAGVLRVTDAARFAGALRMGVGKTGKAYGRGLLQVAPA